MANVVIVDYDPTWPDQFKQLAADLRRHLGGDILGIDHIGSTSVPGLAAKDVIDLQVTVASLTDADRLAPAFQRAGHVLTPYQLDHRPAGDRVTPGCGESACGNPRLGPTEGSTRMSASPDGRTNAMRCCSATTCAPALVPLRLRAAQACAGRTTRRRPGNLHRDQGPGL